MKPLALLLLCFLVLASLSPAADQPKCATAATPSVPAEIGDFHWKGTSYPAAKATVSNDVIEVRVTKKRPAKIPISEAPDELRKKLGIPSDLPPPPAPPGTFVFWQSSEEEITKHYGAPIDKGASDQKPATKRAIYQVQGVRLAVHFFQGKPGIVLATRPKKKLSQGEVDSLLAGCGSKWTEKGGGVYKSSEEATAVWMKRNGGLTVRSAAFIAATK